MTSRENSIVDSIEKRARKIPGLLLRKRHGTQFGMAGDPDLTGCYLGRHVEIEVKRPGEEPTPLQRRRMWQWQQVGALVFACHSAEEFTRRLEEEYARACSVCGSMNTEVVSGKGATGVVAPDGTWEEANYTGIRCRECGTKEER